MKTFKLKKENGYMIPCISDIPENADAVVIMIHGFESCKECPTGQLLLRRMPPAGIGVICYDQPGHGTAEARKEELRIANCMDSLARVEEYIQEDYPDKKIFYFASSYGAYMTGLYISTRPHAGEKLFMRSAAVCMPELFLYPPDTSENQIMRRDLKEKGYFTPNMNLGDPVKVTKGMMEDLAGNDLFEVFGRSDHGGTRVEMVHGEKDAVIPLAKAQAFAEKFQIPLTVMKGQGHSISEDPAAPDKVADLAIQFFREN